MMLLAFKKTFMSNKISLGNLRSSVIGFFRWLQQYWLRMY